MLIMNDLLKEKIRVQKKINKEYIRITHRIAEEFKKSRNQKVECKEH